MGQKFTKTSEEDSSSQAYRNIVSNKDTDIYLAWFGDMNGIEDRYVSNITKWARLNPTANLTLYVDAESTDELRAKQQVFRHKAGEDADSISIVNIHDQFSKDRSQGLPMAREVANLSKKTLIPEIKKTGDRGYAYLKDMVMYYTAATKLEGSNNVVFADLDVTPVRSAHSLFKDGKSNLFIDSVPEGPLKDHVTPNVIAVKDFRNNSPAFIQDSFQSILRSKRSRQDKKDIVKNCTFCMSLAINLQMNSANGKQGPDVFFTGLASMRGMIHEDSRMPEDRKFVITQNQEALGDKTVVQQQQQVENESSRIIARAYKNFKERAKETKNNTSIHIG